MRLTARDGRAVTGIVGPDFGLPLRRLVSRWPHADQHLFLDIPTIWARGPAQFAPAVSHNHPARRSAPRFPKYACNCGRAPARSDIAMLSAFFSQSGLPGKESPLGLGSKRGQIQISSSPIFAQALRPFGVGTWMQDGRTVASLATRRPRRLTVRLFTYSAALIGGLLISAFWLHRIGGLSVRLPLRFLSTHLGTRLGALGLLRGGRLSLHLPLGVSATRPQHLRWRGSWCLSADAPCCHCRRPLSGWYFAMSVRTLHPSNSRCGRWCHMGQPMQFRRSRRRPSNQ